MRLSPKSYPLAQAKKVFGEHLLAGFMLGITRTLGKVMIETQTKGPTSFETIVNGVIKRGKALVIQGKFVKWQVSMSPIDASSVYIVEYWTE